MKWFDRVGIVVWCLILSPLFLLLSFTASRFDWNWWPEFFLSISEAALSVLIVLLIIENYIRMERIRRWELVRSFTYFQILNKLRHLGYFVCSTTLMYQLEPLNIDRDRIERQGLDIENAVFVLRSLADSIREHYNLLFDINRMYGRTGEDGDPMGPSVKSTIECFNNIRHEIDEYKVALVPRVLALSDDVEVNLALLRFEDAIRSNPAKDGDGSRKRPDRGNHTGFEASCIEGEARNISFNQSMVVAF